MKYRAAIPPRVADQMRRLPPDVKRSIREAIRQLCADPECGAGLKRELEGYLKYTVRRYRIVYRVDRAAGAVNVVAIGHRRTIYEEAAEKVRSRRAG